MGRSQARKQDFGSLTTPNEAAQVQSTEQMKSSEFRDPVCWQGSDKTAAAPSQASSNVHDGFTKFSRTKPASRIINPTRFKDSIDRNLNANRAPSAAALSRAGIYERKPSKAPSGYKQSCLPIDERNPILMEIERNKGLRLPREAFKPGMIVRAVLHEPTFRAMSIASDATNAEKYLTDSKYGTIITKYRKFIILALFRNHYLALPIYSHNGRGLEGKAQPDEYVSVQDHRVMAPFTPQSIHFPLVTAQINAGINPFHPKSTVHLTYLVPRSYDIPVVHEGYLDTRSLDRLNKLFHKYVSNEVPG